MPMRATAGSYRLPSPSIKPFWTTRFTSSSHAAFEGAHTSIFGRRTRSSAVDCCSSSWPRIRDMRPRPTLADGDTMLTASLLGESGALLARSSSPASDAYLARLDLKNCWKRIQCSTLRMPHTVCVLPVPGGPWISVNGQRACLSLSAPCAGTVAPAPPKPKACASLLPFPCCMSCARCACCAVWSAEPFTRIVLRAAQRIAKSCVALKVLSRKSRNLGVHADSRAGGASVSAGA